MVRVCQGPRARLAYDEGSRWASEVGVEEGPLVDWAPSAHRLLGLRVQHQVLA